MLSVLRGEEEEDEGKRRRERPRTDFEKEHEGGVRSERGQTFDWGAETCSPQGTPRRPRSGAGETAVPETKSSKPRSPRRSDGLVRGELLGRKATDGRSYTQGVRHGSTLQPKPTQQHNETAGKRRNCQNHQHHHQQDLQGNDSRAVARVEAAAFDTVRPSRLHPRPGSASVEGRSGRNGDARTTPSEATTEERIRPRPRSARVAKVDDDFTDDRKMSAAHGRALVNQGIRRDIQERLRHGRRAHEGEPTPEASMTTSRQHQLHLVRPTTTTTNTGMATAAIRRPASAGGRVVDTRIWCSNKNMTGSAAKVFVHRPNRDVPGASSSTFVPTHAGEVPEFLRRKARDRIEGNREKQAAVKGRFGVVFDDNQEEKSVSGLDGVEYHRTAGPSRAEPHGQRPGASTKESHGWRVEGPSPELSSVRLEDSIDGQGLLPDAGEQAFFDAWKPTGYDIDLSRYD